MRRKLYKVYLILNCWYLILCMLFGVPYIDMLKKRTIGQYIKDVAPENHAKKQGTPTTGGVFIIAAVILASVTTLLLAQKMTTVALITIITLLFYTFAGFQDDYIKIMKSGSMKDLDDNEISNIARRNLKIYDEL